MSEAEIDRLLTASESLRWILRLLFLDQAGLDPELMAARFRLSQRYNYFVRDAADWQPKVYSKKPRKG
ncbi:hypothetical protein GCM10009744_43890 [Kribbella alba]|uniref:Uncharacterized protein n=1 Tax=Kribbella alba TaxID=190197 RepID=A0ABP4REU1_9ACTN